MQTKRNDCEKEKLTREKNNLINEESSHVSGMGFGIKMLINSNRELNKCCARA